MFIKIPCSKENAIYEIDVNFVVEIEASVLHTITAIYPSDEC